MSWRLVAWTMGSPPEPAVPAYRSLTLPWKHRRVLGGDLNCSESGGGFALIAGNLHLALLRPQLMRQSGFNSAGAEALGQDLRRAVSNSGNADRACAHNSHCGSNRDSNQMSDCHDRLHPADDRLNQSANATGGKAEQHTNHVMGLTARPRIQLISERFRSGE